MHVQCHFYLGIQFVVKKKKKRRTLFYRSNTFNSSNSSAVAYGLGHHKMRSFGKCRVRSVSLEVVSCIETSLDI